MYIRVVYMNKNTYTIKTFYQIYKITKYTLTKNITFQKSTLSIQISFIYVSFSIIISVTPHKS